MSRVGKQTIKIPAGVTFEIKNGEIFVKGPKGQLTRKLNDKVEVKIDGDVVSVSVTNEDDKAERSLWGTFSSHIANMVKGVVEVYKKQLEVNGVGYKVSMQGKDLKVEVGFSHPVELNVPEGLTAEMDKDQKNVLIVSGIDKQLVGQFAANIRSFRPPEPYKGKGIRYVGEKVARKAGKSAAGSK